MSLMRVPVDRTTLKENSGTQTIRILQNPLNHRLEPLECAGPDVELPPIHPLQLLLCTVITDYREFHNPASDWGAWDEGGHEGMYTVGV